MRKVEALTESSPAACVGRAQCSSEKVGKPQASEFLISTGKRREIPRWVSNSKRDLLLLQNTLGLEGG